MPFASLPITISRYILICCMLVACKDTPSHKKVEIRQENGRYRLYKNGQPFIVKGGAGFTHLQELAACGGNTIRVWDTTRLMDILEEARHHHLSVIVGLDIPPSEAVETFYKDDKKTDHLYTAYRSLIRQYKDHPALLMWCLGNEVDFPYRFRYTPFYRTFNKLIKMIRAEDPDHPITTTLTNFQQRNIINIKTKVATLDCISINTFNLLKTLDNDLKNFAWVWDGPYLITEWSPDGGWETENITKWQAPIENTSTRKAELVTDWYHTYLPRNDHRFLGALAFYWGAKEEFTHTWFSIFNETGHPTEIMEALRDCWNDTLTTHQSVHIKYMLLDGKGAAASMLQSPGSSHQATVLLAPDQSSEGLHYSWEIVREDWWEDKTPNRRKPVPETGLFIDSTAQAVSFVSPAKEGPYRIFVTVTNAKGYCTTANTPFYVVE